MLVTAHSLLSVSEPPPSVQRLLIKVTLYLLALQLSKCYRQVDTAVMMNDNKDYGIPVPNYTDQNVSTKVVKIIQSYTGVVDKMVWRKY